MARFWAYSFVHDNESSLYYLQSRYYDPLLGRFINADAFASTGQGLLGNNMFAYCGNNPCNYLDNEGLFRQPSTVIIQEGFYRDGSGVVGTTTGSPILDAVSHGAGGAIAHFFAEIFSIVATAFTRAAVASEREETRAIPIALTQETYNYQYWEAERVKNEVIIGNGLTFSEAQIRVACGFDIMCANQGAAVALIVTNGYWTAVGPEIHGDSGYFWHYHPNRHTHQHIWFY